MRLASACLLAASAISGLAAADPAPAQAWVDGQLSTRNDLLGGATWAGQRIGLSLGPFTGLGRSGRGDQSLLGGEAFVDSRAGYAAKPEWGWVLGAKLGVGLYDGSGSADATVGGPRLAVLGGVYGLVQRVRLEIVPEVGAGIAFASYRDGTRGGASTAFRPFPSFGVSVSGSMALDGGRRLGLGLGYLHLQTPYVAPSGVTFTVTYGAER
jgi:hypothetical protein